MTPIQSRVARASLRWSMEDAARMSGVDRWSIGRYESLHTLFPDTVIKLRNAYEAAGVRFFYINDGNVVQGVLPPKSQ